MKRIKLDLEALEIDTFETTVSRLGNGSGTVIGQTHPASYNCDSEWGSCGHYPNTEPDTCDLQNCNYSFPTTPDPCACPTNGLNYTDVGCCYSTADPSTCDCSTLPGINC